MGVMITFARIVGLLGFILIALSACGSTESTPTAKVSGPALVFYTDN